MVKQLSVFIQNRSGKIASIVKALSDAHIDIRALSIADTADFGILRMLVNDITTAKSILSGQNCIVSINEVCVVAVPDTPGGLAQLLATTSNAGIDIEYMYSLISRSEEKAFMVVRVSDEAKLIQVLNEASIEITGADVLGLA